MSHAVSITYFAAWEASLMIASKSSRCWYQVLLDKDFQTDVIFAEYMVKFPLPTDVDVLPSECL